MARQLTLDVTLRDGTDFQTFHPGEQGGLTLEAVRGLARGAGERQIYLFGDAGTGKTHLLQAACHEVAEWGGRVAYLPMGMTAGGGPDVLQGWDGVDLIALDELDRMPWEPDLEQALFNLINGVRDAGGRLLLASRTAPRLLPVALPDLGSRLFWGPVFQLRPLTDPQKCQALIARARQRGFDLSPEVCDYLLRHHRRDLPSLITLLEALDRESLAARRRLTVPFVKHVLDGG
ncbi:regulatory inactivation of DnaA Hda protein [Ectothiorhodospira magna]|uniref:Regulatory inactivation of DnaA Hda protein n=1 Tax=Ectothiorhodospira magna TaxID=867345 RepID=A0A1H9F407_9GAMM|nr:DnaA regulatory inactivator Hda [Ectothiorhodospira magna]SEQ31958.1 regulatory inactivation of DnaA Hda protein [Ectothiorhodospira magna]